MAIEKVGLNLTNLENITPPNISLPTTGKEAIEQVPAIARTVAGGFLGQILIGGLFILSYLILSDKSPFGEFKYSDLRAFTLASGICILIGTTLLEIGFIHNLYIVGIATTCFILGNIILLLTTPSQ